MKKLRKAQADYKAGKITEEQYTAQVAQLLEDGEIDQAGHDQALEYDPEAEDDDEDEDDDKPIYSQADMDRTVVKKARTMVRKVLRDAGVDLDGVNNKDLLTKAAELALSGQNSGKSESELSKEVNDLRKKASMVDNLTQTVQTLTIESAVLKAAGKYKPVNPAQVVRALNADYTDLLEFDDETGALIPKSVDRALKRIAEAEPNLFTPKGDDEDDDQQQQQNNEGRLSGKSPGGGSGSSDKQQQKLEAGKAKALELMGIKKPQN